MQKIEEERRLCFVGMTRAMKHLVLTHTVQRTHRGMRERRIPSQFVRELPDEHITHIDQAGQGQTWNDPYGESEDRAFDHEEPEFMDFHIGSTVRHPQFGVGRIESMERRRDHTRSRIAFAGVGVKTLILEYARLEAVEA